MAIVRIAHPAQVALRAVASPVVSVIPVTFKTVGREEIFVVAAGFQGKILFAANTAVGEASRSTTAYAAMGASSPLPTDAPCILPGHYPEATQGRPTTSRCFAATVRSSVTALSLHCRCPVAISSASTPRTVVGSATHASERGNACVMTCATATSQQPRPLRYTESSRIWARDPKPVCRDRQGLFAKESQKLHSAG